MHHQGCRKEGHFLKARGIYIGDLGVEVLYRVLCNGWELCCNDEIQVREARKLMKNHSEISLAKN